MTLAEITMTGDEFLADCARRAHAAYDRNVNDSTEGNFLIGHALLDARRSLVSDQEYGLWFRDQRFGFSRQWGVVLRHAAEHESLVREEVASQLATGQSNFQEAVRTVRAALAQAVEEERIATVTPITGKLPFAERCESVRTLAATGLNSEQIAERIGVTASRVCQLAAAAGIPLGKTSRLAIKERVDLARTLAATGMTSEQIADQIGVTASRVRQYGRKHDIEFPADATSHTRRDIDSTRVVEAAIHTIDGIGVMFDHIDYAELPAEEISGWLTVLNSSIRSLTTLRKQLKEISQP